MSFGFGFGLPRIFYGSRAFSPASLFASGAPGVWYDPSDFTTLFQDSSGTTPVTAVEQFVGLMLDKSQGLALGPELVTNGSGDSTANWIPTSATIASVGGELELTSTVSGTFQVNYQISTTVGRLYKLTATVRRGTCPQPVNFGFNGVGSTSTNSTVNTSLTVYLFANASSINVQFFSTGAIVGSTFYFDNISVKELPGNHAFQSTNGSRPVVSARVNLLTKTEQFDDAVWTKASVTVTANATTAPDGTTTADKIVATNTASTTRGVYQSFTPISGAQYTISFVAKAAEYSNFSITEIGGGRFGATFNLTTETTTSLGGAGFVSSSITATGNGWYRCVIVATGGASGWAVTAVGYPTGATLNTAGISYAGDGTSGIFIWGADLRVTNDTPAPVYQRVNTSTDYDTVGFPVYLKFDGTDDSMLTNNINFTSTDKMSAFAGVRKLSDAAIGMIYELSTSFSSNPGTFALYSTNDSTYKAASSGTLFKEATSTSLPSPRTNVLTEIASISGDQLDLRVNGVLNAQNTGDQGTGNFGTYPLYIGRRANASLPFNGQIYSLIIVGKAVTATELASTETYVGIETGFTAPVITGVPTIGVTA
jgi:hypothetical protein